MTGRGVERPFRCHEHEDSNASASVNVLKGVWFCYGCQARGVVDGKRVPTAAELAAMIEPEAAARELPESFLATYGVGGYWLDRFPDWVCWLHGLGENPWTGEGVYPVHTPRGRLAGVCRRHAMPGPGPKYRYPTGWSASRSLFGSRGQWRKQRVVTLVEGAPDVAAMWEVGVPTWGVYGAGIHAPQVELIAQMSPDLVLIGFDEDEAGARATEQTQKALFKLCPTATVTWKGGKDAADCTPAQRRDSITESVSRGGYGQYLDAVTEAMNSIPEEIRLRFVEEAA